MLTIALSWVVALTVAWCYDHAKGSQGERRHAGAKVASTGTVGP